jgi:phosphatidylglycerol---prolipoprotein diacylglyceryl transferase
MFIQNINPILFSAGFLQIRFYGLIYALGFLISYLYLRKKRTFLGLDEENLDKLFLYIIIGDIIGARLFEFVFYNPSVFITNPIEILKIWNGGLSFHGGLIGILLGIYFFCKKNKISMYKVMDTLVIPASFVLFLGRIANFINSELVGTITQVPWAVNFHGEKTFDGQLVGRHPVQLYASLKNLFNFFVLYSISKYEEKHNSYKEGFRFWIFVLLYGMLRTITNIWRDDYKWFFQIFDSGQLLSAIMFLVASFVLLKYYLPNKEEQEIGVKKHKKHKNTSKK